MRVNFAGNFPKIFSCSKHIHNDYEIIFCMSGSATSIINGTSQNIDESYITLLSPHTPHGILNGEDYGDLYIRTDTCPIIAHEFMYVCGNTDIIRNLATSLCTIWVKKENNYQTICDGLLQVIYDLIVNLAKKKNKFDFVDKFKNVLSINLSNPDFNIANAASEFGINSDYLRQCFKIDTGFTPLEYLTKLRIDQAKRYLLYDKHYSISEIANLCGFVDPYYFSRCFKKHTTHSPKEYKNMNK